jgi:hypothetical protein
MSSALARANRIEEAELCMEKAMLYANHLGLYSEALDRRGVPIGEFPPSLDAPGLHQRGAFPEPQPVAKSPGLGSLKRFVIRPGVACPAGGGWI